MKWSQIAAGNHDAYLRAAAAAMKADSRWTSANPYHFAFRHEMCVNTPTQPAGGTPSEYRAAFRHVRSLFEAANATVPHGGNVVFCFSPNSSMFQPTAPPGHRVTEFDPGHSFYEMVGVDIYEHYGSSYQRSAAEWVKPAQVCGECGPPFRDRRARDRGAGRPSAKAGYIADIATAVKSYGMLGPGSCAAVLWTNKIDAKGDYRLDSSAESLAAFAATGLDQFFAASPV